MVLDFNGKQVEVEIKQMEVSKERHGGYLVVDTWIEFKYITPPNTTPFVFESWVYDNHINELIEIYQDEQ